jgi:hypothetical protein
MVDRDAEFGKLKECVEAMGMFVSHPTALSPFLSTRQHYT